MASVAVMIKGFDISNHQGQLPDFFFQRTDFVIAKVTQDPGYVDKWFKIYRQQARDAECGFGGYHFMDMDLQPSPEASVDFFLENLGEQHTGEIAALDAELVDVDGEIHNTNPDQLDYTLRWGRVFRDRTGYKPYLYLSRSWIDEHNLNHPEIADAFELWYAYWLDNPDDLSETPDTPDPWLSAGKDIKLWQYTIRTYDEDVFLGAGGLAEFRASGKPEVLTPAQEYERLYWTPMQKLLNTLVENSSAQHTHANAAFHAAVSNNITLHKIALGVESA